MGEAERKGMQEEQLPLVKERQPGNGVLYYERNILSMPFFVLNSKLVGKQGIITIRCSNPTGKGTWTVSTNIMYGFGGPFDDAVLMAVFKNISDLTKPVINPIRIGSYKQIAKTMGYKDPGVTVLKEVRRSLLRIKSLLITAEHSFFDKTSGDYLRGDEDKQTNSFSVFDEVQLIDKKKNPHVTENLVWLNWRILNNINAGYSCPIVSGYYFGLNNPTSRALFKILITSFYKQSDIPFRRYKYSNLCKRAHLTRHLYKSLAEQQLIPSMEELKKTAFLEDYKWEETKDEEGRKDWLLYFWPGPRVDRYREMGSPEEAAAEYEEEIISVETDVRADVQTITPEMEEQLLGKGSGIIVSGMKTNSRSTFRGKTPVPQDLFGGAEESIPVAERPAGGGKERYSESGADKPKKPPRKETNPDIRLFLEYYSQAFKEKFGESPHIIGGKDGELVRKLLSGRPLEKLMRLLDLFFEMDDDFVRRSGYTVGVFSAILNKLVVEEVKREKAQENNLERRAEEFIGLYARLFGEQLQAKPFVNRESDRETAREIVTAYDLGQLKLMLRRFFTISDDEYVLRVGYTLQAFKARANSLALAVKSELIERTYKSKRDHDDLTTVNDREEFEKWYLEIKEEDIAHYRAKAVERLKEKGGLPKYGAELMIRMEMHDIWRSERGPRLTT